MGNRIEKLALQFIQEMGLGDAFFVWSTTKIDMFLASEVKNLANMNKFDPKNNTKHKKLLNALNAVNEGD